LIQKNLKGDRTEPYRRFFAAFFCRLNTGISTELPGAEELNSLVYIAPILMILEISAYGIPQEPQSLVHAHHPPFLLCLPTREYSFLEFLNIFEVRPDPREDLVRQLERVIYNAVTIPV
jgi:hypothetical protein